VVVGNKVVIELEVEAGLADYPENV
jgi:hypothetical protein